MPTYQYACTACDERLEVVQKFSDDPLTSCPACEGRLRKVFSAVGVVFKGSGFYKTDSRTGAGKGAKDSGGSTGSDSSTGSTATAASDSGGGATKSEAKSDKSTTPAPTGSKVA